MKDITTEMEVAAPAERIWQLLADFSLYPRWNPLFVKAEGELATGARATVTVKLPRIDPFTIAPTIVAADPQASIEWAYRYPFPALFGWDYRITLEPAGTDRLRIIQRSTFRGILAPLFAAGLQGAVQEGCEQLNAALKRWGERGKVRCLKC